MARTQELEQLILQVLGEYRDDFNRSSNTPVQLIADREAKHYQVAIIGWENKKRHFGVLVHFSIQNNKIYLEYNGTEEDFVRQLEVLGVRKDEVVVAFHAPYLRSLTGYAVE